MACGKNPDWEEIWFHIWFLPWAVSPPCPTPEKGAWHDHQGGCQHPLGAEHHFRGDIQGFTLGFSGQKTKGKELERSSDHSARKDVLCVLLLLHEHLGKGDVGTSSEQKHLIKIKSTCLNPAVFTPQLKSCWKQNLDFYHFTDRKSQAGSGEVKNGAETPPKLCWMS